MNLFHDGRNLVLFIGDVKNQKIFFKSTVNTVDNLDIFDGAIFHTSRDSFAQVGELFPDGQTVSKLPRSQDLSIYNLYMWENLKQKVYANYPHILDEPKKSNTNTIRSIAVELKAVSVNMLQRPTI